MAIGDKKPVVMQADREIPGGVATLDENGHVPFVQLGNVVGTNLLINSDFRDVVDQREGWVVKPDMPCNAVAEGDPDRGRTESYYNATIDDVGNPHFFVNGEERFVNAALYPDAAQRGYAASFSHTIDCWLTGRSGSAVLVGDGYIEINELGDLFQRVDMDLSGKTVTASILTDTGLKWGTAVVPQTHGEFATAFVDDTVTILLGCFKNDGMTQFSVMSNNANTHKLLAAKLELGSIQTLAHRDADGRWVLNDPPPNKALELAKCQRYQLPLTYSNYRATHCLIDYMEFLVPTPVTMRAHPAREKLNCEIRTVDGAVQTGFTFEAYSQSNGVKVAAYKEGHGLTDGVLSFLADGIFDANL